MTRRFRPASRTGELAIVVASLIPFLAVTLSHINAVPIWDSYQYATELIAAASGPWALPRFNLAGHPSFLFTIPGALFVALFGPVAAALNSWSIAIGALGIGSFATLSSRWIPSRIDRVLLASTLGVCPAVTSAMLQFNPDTGVFGFFLLSVAALVSGSLPGTVVAGLFLVFSKETGLLLYIALAVAWSLSLGRSASPRTRVSLGLPVAAFAAHAIAMRLGHARVFWHVAAKGPVGGLVSQVFERSRSVLLIREGYFAVVTVLNFAWVPSAVLIGVLFFAWLRTPPRRWWPALRAIQPKNSFLVLLSVGSAGALFAFPTFVNTRYQLPLFALLLLAFGGAMARFAKSNALRRFAFSAVFALFLLSNFRTIDPVSRVLWGTFPFGRHEMLDMTSVTKECCDFGRDQLVYNLEYLHFGELLDPAFASILSSRPAAVIVFPRWGWSETWPPMRLDRVSHHRTLEPSGVVPVWAEAEALARTAGKPKHITYVAWPNTYWWRQLLTLRRFYRIVRTQRFSNAGYAIEAFDMELQ